jgi:CRISPR/Cas system-associated exonuclease Cas4 (RecB family)
MSAREQSDDLWDRFDEANTVAVTDISSQLYCEKQVDLEREHGERDTKAKKRGREIHRRALRPGNKRKRGNMWGAIERGERQVAQETSFIGEAAEFLIVGVPDTVVFHQGKPQLIFERKSTKNAHKLFPNQRIQPWLYGYILQSLGFATDELKIAILTHTQSLDKDRGRRLQMKIIQNSVSIEGESKILIDDPTAKLYQFEYSPIEYLKEFRYRLEYWRGSRDPEPTENQNKCRPCLFKDVCPDCLV